MSSEDGQLMPAIADSDQLKIFECDVVRDLIDYKWQRFARIVHVRGLIFHTIYIVVLSMYIRAEYLKQQDGVAERVPHKGLLGGIAVCLIYPLLYDGTQLLKQGWEVYFFSESSFWNYIDMLHIVLGYLNIFLQLIFPPRHIVNQLVMVFIILFMLFKLFFFLRIIQKFSVITTMIMECIADLKVFSLFFVIMIIHFGMAMNVLAKNPQVEF